MTDGNFKSSDVVAKVSQATGVSSDEVQKVLHHLGLDKALATYLANEGGPVAPQVRIAISNHHL